MLHFKTKMNLKSFPFLFFIIFCGGPTSGAKEEGSEYRVKQNTARNEDIDENVLAVFFQLRDQMNAVIHKVNDMDAKLGEKIKNLGAKITNTEAKINDIKTELDVVKSIPGSIENLIQNCISGEQQDNKRNVLQQKQNLSTSPGQTSEKIAYLFSDFSLLRELDVSDFNETYYDAVRFQIDEGYPPIYLKGVGWAGRPSKETEEIRMHIFIEDPAESERRPWLCNMDISYTAEANKTTMIDLNKSVQILPNKEYRVFMQPITGGIAKWKNPKEDIDIVLYNEEDGLTNPIKLKFLYSANLVYSLKFSLSE